MSGAWGRVGQVALRVVADKEHLGLLVVVGAIVCRVWQLPVDSLGCQVQRRFGGDECFALSIF